MSNLNAFLHPVQGDETREIIVSNRFLDENGRPVPFRIRALTQEENDAISKRSMRLVKAGGEGAGQHRIRQPHYCGGHVGAGLFQ